MNDMNDKSLATIVKRFANADCSWLSTVYDWDIVTDDDYDVVIAITPTKLLAWGDEGAETRTRWSGAEVTAVTL